MNNSADELAALAKLVDRLDVYSAHCLKVLTKKGDLVPFIWNKAQRYIHHKLEEQKAQKGYVRALILKGRQQGCCLAPETKVLTADLRWVRIDSLTPGQSLVATDEETTSRAPGAPGGGRGRKMRTATVEAVVFTRQPSYRITLDDGRELVTSGKHRWLVRKSQTQWLWRAIEGSTADGRDGIKVGDKLRSVTRPWGEPTLDDAWFGGVIDGEGSLDFKGTGVSLAVSQRANGVLMRMDEFCAIRQYGHYIVSDDGPRKTKFGLDPVHAITLSNLSTMFEVIGRSRPVRFIDQRWWDGKSMPDNGERSIVKIEFLGDMDVVDIQTSTGTFLAEGLVSHNSTYVAARYYNRASTNFGRRAFIVSHEEKSTTNLFNMVKRYDDHNPLAPSKRSSNAQELVFGRLDSGYKLATAGSKDVGRGNTAQMLHGSEFAFWANAQTHLAGLGNSIPLDEGTEIILESTANGLGNAFHLMWGQAEAGIGEYIAIFVPWMWQDEYRLAVPPGFALTDEEIKYQAAFGCDLEQMSWRRAKLLEYGQGFEWLFNQEYPAIASLAFQTSTRNPLISPENVNLAATSKYRDDGAPLVIGCDPAGDGANDPDRTAIVFRRGRMVFRAEYHEGLNTMQIAGKLAEYHAEMQPDAIFVDKGGLGAGTYDRLLELNVPVIGINNAERARDPERYENKRAECWHLMAEWFADQPCRIPNNSALISDICAPEPRVSSNGRKLVEKKEDMKKRGIRSPDGADALALTFAEPVMRRPSTLAGGGWKAPTTAGY